MLILLLTEISHNGEVIRTVQDRINPDQTMEDLIGHPHFSTQKVKTWDNVQERAAALLPDDLMAALDEYYAPLEALLTLVRFPNMAADSFDRTIRGEIQEMKPAWSVAATRQPYREQLQKLLDAQEGTPAKIEEYLAQPRWGVSVLEGGSVGRGAGVGRLRRAWLPICMEGQVRPHSTNLMLSEVLVYRRPGGSACITRQRSQGGASLNVTAGRAVYP